MVRAWGRFVSDHARMPRIAIGDLTLDLDVPPRFTCEYTLNGSLIAESRGTGEVFELSVIDVNGGAIEVVTERAAKAERPPQEERDDFVSYFDGRKAWFAAIPEHVLVATLVRGSPPEFAAILASVAPAHAPFTGKGAMQVEALRPSHARFFEQRRTALLDAIGWSPQLGDAVPRLEAFWRELLDAPPAELDLLSTMRSGAAVAFGDLLCTRGFSWAVGHDPAYGTALGVVALRGTANVWVVPIQFMLERWRSRERDFIGAALTSLEQRVQNVRS